MNYDIFFSKDKNIEIYRDANYARDTESRKSTSGFLIIIGIALTNWYSKLQPLKRNTTVQMIVPNSVY
eukprot:jgi/Orpsp1_1/1176962/evm.model.c7180000059647.1